MIRLATPEDAQRIAEIHIASWTCAYRDLLPADYLSKLDVESRTAFWNKLVGNPKAPLYISLRGDQITGFCHIMPSRDEDSVDIAEITAIYLDPPYWRNGNGRELCLAALAFAVNHGFTCVTLWVLLENQEARRFYEALGFYPDELTKTEQCSEFALTEIRYRYNFIDKCVKSVVEESRATLRPAGIADQNVVFGLHVRVFRKHIEEIGGWDNTWQVSNFMKQWLDVQTEIIVQDSETLGYLQTRREHDHLYILNLAIDPRFQSQKLGSIAVEVIKQRAELLGYPIKLSVFRTNLRVTEFYKRLGFEVEAETETGIKMQWQPDPIRNNF